MSKSYSKFPDINALLEKGASSLKTMEELYMRSLHDQNIPALLLMAVKDFLGDLRSSLDYLNAKIPKSGNYFPICDHPNDFAARYKGVADSTRAALERWQPYNGHTWFKQFNLLNNKNKHVSLTPQRRIEQRRVTVSHPSGGSVSWGPGVTFGAGVSIMGVPIDPRTQMPVPNQAVNTDITIWVDFVFDNSGELSILPTNLSVLGFLKESFQKVTAAVQDIEATLV
jgi:hypothetical protein